MPRLTLTNLLMKPLLILTNLLKKLTRRLEKVKIRKVEIGVMRSKMLKLLWMPLGKHKMLLMLAWTKPSKNCQSLRRVLRNLRLQVLNNQTLMKLRH